MKRKIAAIVAADVAGYSKLVAEDEEDALRRLETSREVFDEFVSRYGGRIFNTAGDAVLAEFASAVEAVRCALEIQESLRTKNLGVPEHRQMLFRLGINIGDIVERDGDLLGDGVNIAARLQGLAKPGGICVSRAVYEQVENKLAVGFADIGLQAVKNIPNPIHAYFVDSRLGRPRRAGPAINLQAAVLAIAGIVALGIVGAMWIWLMREAPSQAAATRPAPQGQAAASAPSASPSPAPAVATLPPPAPPPAEARPASPPAPVASPLPAPPAASNSPPSPPSPAPAIVTEPPKSTASAEAVPARPGSDAASYEVAFACEKLEWTGGALYQTDVSVKAGIVEFARPIHWPTVSSPVIGTELGKGTVDRSGRMVIDAGWASQRRRYTARYEGVVNARGGTLSGRQDWISDGKAYARKCTMTLSRK